MTPGRRARGRGGAPRRGRPPTGSDAAPRPRVDHVLDHEQQLAGHIGPGPHDLLLRVPVRQWVLSMPIRARLALTFRPDLVQRALAIVVRRLQAYFLKKTGGQTGLVTAIQRFGSSLNLNVHFHILALDGGYHHDDQGRLQFRASRPPRHDELTRMVQEIGRRLERLVN